MINVQALWKNCPYMVSVKYERHVHVSPTYPIYHTLYEKNHNYIFFGYGDKVKVKPIQFQLTVRVFAISL